MRETMPVISQADRVRLQSHLRRLLHSPGITLDPTETQGGTAQVRIGDTVLGTIDQVAGRATTVSSGFATSARPPPLRPRLPLRGPCRLGWSTRLGFLPCDGGTDELSGVFGGSLSLASSAVTRAVRA